MVCVLVLQTDAEIQADCLDESLVGVSRCLHILSKGAPAQRWSVLDSLWQLVESDGAPAFDALFPPLLRILCTWEADLQSHAATVYSQVLARTRDLGERIRRREEEDVYMYDPADLPPLPWQIDRGRIEKWLLPTILLMADTEGSALKEATAHHWLEPLLACMRMVSPECVVERVLAFAVHKRDPTASVASRNAAATLMGPLASLLQPNQIQESEPGARAHPHEKRRHDSSSGTGM